MYRKDRGKKGFNMTGTVFRLEACMHCFTEKRHIGIVLVRREKPWQQRRLQFCTVPSSTRRSEEMQLM